MVIMLGAWSYIFCLILYSAKLALVETRKVAFVATCVGAQSCWFCSWGLYMCGIRGIGLAYHVLVSVVFGRK